MDISFWCILWKRMESNDGSIGGNFFLGGGGYSCMHVKFVTWERWWIKLCTECVQFNWIFLVISHFCIFHNNIYIFSFLRLLYMKKFIIFQIPRLRNCTISFSPPGEKFFQRGDYLMNEILELLRFFKEFYFEIETRWN